MSFGTTFDASRLPISARGPISARTGTPPSTSRLGTERGYNYNGGSWEPGLTSRGDPHTGRGQLTGMEEYLNSRSTISAMEQEWSLMRQTMALLSDKVAKLETLVRRVEWRVTRFQELREKVLAQRAQGARKSKSEGYGAGAGGERQEDHNAAITSVVAGSCIVQKVFAIHRRGAGSGVAPATAAATGAGANASAGFEHEQHIELHLYPCGFELDSDTDDEEDGPRDADLIVVIAVEPPGCAEYVTGLRVVDAHGRPVAYSAQPGGGSTSKMLTFSTKSMPLPPQDKAHAGDLQVGDEGDADGGSEVCVPAEAIDEFVICCELRKSPILTFHTDGSLDF